MTGWLPPEDFAKVVASRVGFQRKLKQLTTDELVEAFHANVVEAKQEIAKLRREIADCMPGDIRLHGTKETVGLIYLHTKASCEARGWEEYLTWARTGQGQAAPLKREPIAPAKSWVEPREPGEDDDSDLPF